jgi:hypothetical protein
MHNIYLVINIYIYINILIKCLYLFGNWAIFFFTVVNGVLINEVVQSEFNKNQLTLLKPKESILD